jgi:carboxyl-terminal processing protease
LVNAGSASASELLSATLQDYHRALIVGSPTFGKATAQSMLPIDTTIRPWDFGGKPENPKWTQTGYVIMTMSKFYRVTRASHQNQGVQPDVFLPEIFLSETKESKLPYALLADSVNKKVIYTPLPGLPTKELAEQSAARISHDEAFEKIKHVVDSLNASVDKEKKFPLVPDAFRKNQKTDDALYKSFDDYLTRPAVAYTVSNNKFDQELVVMDEYGKEINDTLLKETHEDIYLEEAFRIMLNLIDLTK